MLSHVLLAGISFLRSVFNFIVSAVEFEVDRLAVWHVQHCSVTTTAERYMWDI